MAKKKENLVEIAVYTAESSAMAEMLIEKLSNLGIPTRLGNESAGAGVFGVPGASRTIWVPEKFASSARNILKSGK
ncbi:MAG: hypothetical protein A2172_03120 [Candidatus Woykebacteria bacterium RBG_13_40_15]|uniref:DUF2007 domain-containing protein n=1 Tax=Candidatus Woykebacteria bacterium RBG_13_40_15 TaxID=1802593 RepID=A0A1G1W5L9_9BACT|nr:MAG: hypothetical protein A2172_03120 [Candidatus Woykebacteria bacterium RBG_13_40_15]